LWSQLRPDDCSIQVEATEFIEPKHGSSGTVYVDPALMKELLSFRTAGQEGFVLGMMRRGRSHMLVESAELAD